MSYNHRLQPTFQSEAAPVEQQNFLPSKRPCSTAKVSVARGIDCVKLPIRQLSPASSHNVNQLDQPLCNYDVRHFLAVEGVAGRICACLWLLLHLSASPAKSHQLVWVQVATKTLLSKLLHLLRSDHFSLHKKLLLQASQLPSNEADVRDGELFGVLLHILQSGVVPAHELEGRAVDYHGGANLKVLRYEPCASCWVLLLGFEGKLSLSVARVSRAKLPHSHAVICKVDGHHKPAIAVLGLSVDHLALEAQDFALIAHELVDVASWGPGGEVQAACHRVLVGAKAGVRWIRELYVDRPCIIHWKFGLIPACVTLVEFPSEGIAIVQVDAPAIDLHGLPNYEILRLVVQRIRLHHAGRRTHVWVFPQLRSSPEDGIWVAARVPWKIL